MTRAPAPPPSEIASFWILPPPPPTPLLNLEPSSLSDHSPIMTWLNINTVNNQLAMEYTNDTLFVYLNSLYGKMIHGKNLRRHCRQETYRERYMTFLLTVDQKNTLYINSSLDAVEIILFTTAKIV